MLKILIFRTDRIGDLIVSCPLILTIKKHFKESEISIVTSDKNHDYAKSLNIFDRVYVFPNNYLFNKFNFIRELKNTKFDYVFVFDGKDRSVISSVFLTSKNKFALIPKIKFFHKILNIEFFEDTEHTHLYAIYEKILNRCNIDSKIVSFDFLLSKLDNKFSENFPIKEYLHIHLDEKWHSELYIKSYTDIDPKYDDFVDFITSLSVKNDILITTGLIDTDLILALKNRFFMKINDKIFHNKKSNKTIYLVYKPTFEDIESILRKSKLLITCHGAVTHAANSFNIKKIDIIEEKKINHYKRFTTYLSKYHPIYRSDFNLLKVNLLNIASN